MPATQPIHRKALNPEQLRVLYALYKFRFGTTDLLLTSQNKHITRQYMNIRLRILCEQEYIGRKYDSSYKLQAKFATYHLLPKGIEVLEQKSDVFNSRVLRSIRNDHKASALFIRHSLSIFAAYAKLKEAHGDSFKFFTKSYLNLPKFDYFPKPKPDAYMTFGQDEATGKTKHYLLECFDSTMPHSVMKKRLEELVIHADSDEWTPNSPYPDVILVCKDERLRKLVQGWAKKSLEDGWAKELVIAATIPDEVIKAIRR